ncbi:MAG: molybdopterin converting factor subunit 1 [Planctomycetaceae bacterium]|nr:molybdopterin converting factor subunit 1 [Planctomycetaceae bacterium]
MHRVKLFAAIRQRIGRDELEVELPSAATVRQLRGALAEQFPPLAGVLAHTRIAVDSEYANDDRQLCPASEIALIPPVSGG